MRISQETTILLAKYAKMDLKGIVLIGAAIYFLSQRAGQYAYDNFSVSAAKVGFSGLSWQGASGEMELVVKNKTAVPVTVQSIAGNVLYSGASVAQYLVSSPFTIQANGATSVNIPFFVPYEGVIDSLSNAIAMGNFATFAQIEGVAKVGGVNIPFSQPLSPI